MKQGRYKRLAASGGNRPPRARGVRPSSRGGQPRGDRPSRRIPSKSGLAKEDIAAAVENWMLAWNRHDLDGVLSYMSKDVVFEHWNGLVTRGANALRSLWHPWFQNHGGFRFELTNLVAEKGREAAAFEWTLYWPSRERGYRGLPEIRKGIDVVRFRGGKIIEKRSYIRTRLMIAGRPAYLKV